MTFLSANLLAILLLAKHLSLYPFAFSRLLQPILMRLLFHNFLLLLSLIFLLICHCQTLWARWLFRTSMLWFQSSWNLEIIYCGRIFFFRCCANSVFLVLSMMLKLLICVPSFLLQTLLLRIHNLIDGMITIKASWFGLFQLSLKISSLILWVLNLHKFCRIFLKWVFCCLSSQYSSITLSTSKHL